MKKRAKKSLRGILTWWFLTFSIIPLTFLSGYSIVLYESSLNAELKKRLLGNLREVSVSLGELEDRLANNGKIHSLDPTLVYHVATRNVPSARRVVNEWLKTSLASRIVLFDREGKLVISQIRTASGEPKTQANLETGDFYLADTLLKEIDSKSQEAVREVQSGVGLQMIVYTRIVQKDGHTAGYLEEVIELGEKSFLDGLRKRLNLEAVIFDDKNQPAAASNPDFMLYPKDFFSGKIGSDSHAFFELTSRGEPYGMIVRKIVDQHGKPYVTLGLATSKLDSEKVLSRIKLTLFTMSLIILLFLIPTLIYVSNRVVNPIHRLVEATEKMESGEKLITLKQDSDTEIGILIQAFNEMSRNIASTQATLVHSAKMASLGQLVAGVAHELNNPIGFIYSNMTHLREYVEKLLKVLRAAEKDPDKLDKVKKEVEFDFLVEDLPKLIASCEDGARRTRDIVLGLRNFSRLDEAQLKRVDLHEGLRNTLKLLASELKNRITVREDYANLPQVRCFASQLNQVFMNIISNAAQAIEKEGTIWIKTSRDGQYAVVSIRDSGPGIPKADLDKIFDPFFTTKDIGQGTGLGLSISYGIVQKHEGDIKVYSDTGKGTEFVIRVPVDGPSDEKDPAAKSATKR